MRLALLALLLAASCRPAIGPEPGAPAPSPPAAPTLQEARAFAASQPRYLRPVPQQAVPAGLPDLRASTCGACHVDFYAEWAASTHARAWTDDAQFMAELHKSESPKDGQPYDVAWMCRNCHTPLENQLERLVARLDGGRQEAPVYVDNPHFDRDLQQEAITCATCHVRDGVVLGPWGNTEAPHPVGKGDELLTPAVCTQCHEASAHFERISLACTFTTGTEHQQGPHRDEPCSHCHMPEVRRPLVAGFPERATRRHWFGGSLIPKAPRFAQEVAAFARHYPHGIATRWDPPEELPAGSASVRVTYSNAEAGHLLPSGDPERFILVTLEVWRGEARIAHRTERIGAVFQWHPVVEKVSDNRMRPGEERELELAFEALPGELELRLRVEKHRIGEEAIAYHGLQGEVVPSIVVTDERVPVRVR